MKAVILAAGKSTRTYPFTVNKPKPLLRVLNQSIIKHNLTQLKGIVKEAIIIVGFMKEEIIKHLGKEFQGIKITYVEQKEQKGTGHAILTVESKLTSEKRFLVIAGDDLYCNCDLRTLSNVTTGALVQETKEPYRFGIYEAKGDMATKLVEKPAGLEKGLANTSAYILEQEIFQILKKTKVSERGEIELTSAIEKIIEQKKFKLIIVKGYWIPITYPWNLLEANVYFLNQIKKSSIKGKIEEHVTIRGTLIIGKGTVIKSGTYIEGPVFIGENCEIGPNAYLRKDTIIENNVKTRAEIIDSVIMQGAVAKHDSYIGHSIIGENVNYAAGSITADYRHDSGNHTTLINDQKVATGRRKLGAFIGDNVRTGIGTLIYPGRKIWPGKTTMPGEVIKEDLK